MLVVTEMEETIYRLLKELAVQISQQ